MKLREVPARCFQGVTPAIIATCDAAGTPNVTHLSQVFRIDDERVALSCQFFNKTKKNVLEHPIASIQLDDPLTFDTFRLVIRFDHAETEGELFAQMSRRIDAIASHTGMSGVFRLLSADVYTVLSVEQAHGFKREVTAEPPPLPAPEFRGEMSGLQYVSQRVARARDLEELYTCTVEALREGLGFENAMILLPDESNERLYAIAGCGYGESGVGAEVGFGEGLIGTVARERCVLRVSGVGAELRYGRAIRTSVQRAAGVRGLRPEIPLPGLVDAQSQMALPLVAGGRLVGVIAVESNRPAAFQEWHEAFLDIIANQIATAIDVMTLREKDDDEASPPGRTAADVPPRAGAEAQPKRATATAGTSLASLKLRFFKSDDCVFADDEYLVRNVPGRILWKVVQEYVTRGRTEFNNRELRLDASLGLPSVRDNLESRLVLLRKRLDQKCPLLKMVTVARGRFRLEVGASLQLEEAP